MNDSTHDYLKSLHQKKKKSQISSEPKGLLDPISSFLQFLKPNFK